MQRPNFLDPKRLMGVLIVALVCLLSPQVAGAQSSEGLTSEANYTYDFTEDGDGVDVTIDLAVTNVKPSQSNSRGTTQYYFTGYYVSIPENATDVTISQDGVALEFERIEDTGFTTLDFGFRRNLFYRSTANVDISFTLASGGPRSASPARVNAAYVGFEIWATPTVDTASIEVSIPPGFVSDREVRDGSMTTREDGTSVLVIDDITANEFYFDYVALRNDDNLTVRSVEVDGIEIEIQHWPNDAAWADFIEERIVEDLGPLVDTVGLPWPLDEPLIIQESSAPALNGYGGWYIPALRTIEVGENFDDQLVLHEIAHVWSNTELFESRWITEGLADELSAIVEADGGDPADPEPVSTFDANALPLLEWTPGFGSAETESWAYNASWTVTRELVDIIGVDQLQTLLAAASNNEYPYLGEGEAETFSGVPTWKNYLDWVQEIPGEGDPDDAEELFRDWVVPQWQHAQLDDRAAARDRFDELTNAGADWANPLVVREQMTAWNFDEAIESIDDALAVLTERDRAFAMATELGVTVPDQSRLVYQDAATDLVEALAAATELADNAEALVTIDAAFDAERSFFTTVGLLGVDPAEDMTAATAAFEAGDFEAMAASGDALDDTLGDAEGHGQLRVGLAVGALLVVLIGLGLILRRRRGPKIPNDISELVDGDLSEPVAV